MTLEELRQLRDKTKTQLNNRDISGKEIQVIIGMGTCGIAAGAKETLDAFISALNDKKIDNVIVKQTGCMGLCYVEPTVEVCVPGMPNTIYGKVSADVASKIVEEHILGKKLVDAHIFDKPAADILA